MRDLLAAFGHKREGSLALLMPVASDERVGEVLIANRLDVLLP